MFDLTVCLLIQQNKIHVIFQVFFSSRISNMYNSKIDPHFIKLIYFSKYMRKYSFRELFDISLWYLSGIQSSFLNVLNIPSLDYSPRTFFPRCFTQFLNWSLSREFFAEFLARFYQDSFWIFLTSIFVSFSRRHSVEKIWENFRKKFKSSYQRYPKRSVQNLRMICGRDTAKNSGNNH